VPPTASTFSLASDHTHTRTDSAYLFPYLFSSPCSFFLRLSLSLSLSLPPSLFSHLSLSRFLFLLPILILSLSVSLSLCLFLVALVALVVVVAIVIVTGIANPPDSPPSASIGSWIESPRDWCNIEGGIRTLGNIESQYIYIYIYILKAAFSHWATATSRTHLQRNFMNLERRSHDCRGVAKIGSRCRPVRECRLQYCTKPKSTARKLTRALLWSIHRCCRCCPRRHHRRHRCRRPRRRRQHRHCCRPHRPRRRHCHRHRHRHRRRRPCVIVDILIAIVAWLVHVWASGGLCYRVASNACGIVVGASFSPASSSSSSPSTSPSWWSPSSSPSSSPSLSPSSSPSSSPLRPNSAGPSYAIVERVRVRACACGSLHVLFRCPAMQQRQNRVPHASLLLAPEPSTSASEPEPFS